MPELTDGLTKADLEAVEKARKLDEGFSVAEPAEGEEPEDKTVTAPEITVEQLTRMQETLKTLGRRVTEAEGLVRRYVAKYGQLED